MWNWEIYVSKVILPSHLETEISTNRERNKIWYKPIKLQKNNKRKKRSKITICGSQLVCVENMFFNVNWVNQKR